VDDGAAFAALMDQVAPLYDLRQGAAHGALPFREDPLKTAFYRALQRETDLLHVTAMRVEDELVAAHVGIRSRNTVLVGMPAHSPRYTRHSAGKLLFYELALLLEQEGVDALDLTPGGEYKDRFATHFDEASTVIVVFSRAGAWRHRQQRRLIDAAKRRGVSTDAVKQAIRAVRHRVAHLRPATLPLRLARRLRRAAWNDVELRIYRFPRGTAVTHHEAVPIARDRLEDLACYAPAEGWQPAADAFLRTASERLENGEHCYTRVEDGVLAHYGWLVDRGPQGVDASRRRRRRLRLLHAPPLPRPRHVRLGARPDDPGRRGHPRARRDLHQRPRRQRALAPGHREARVRLPSQLPRAAPLPERPAMVHRRRRRTRRLTAGSSSPCSAPRGSRS
jgi:hypothetical protein